MTVQSYIPGISLSAYVHKYIHVDNGTGLAMQSAMIPRGYPAFIWTYPDQPVVKNHLYGLARDYVSGRIYFNGIVTGSVFSSLPTGCSFIVALLEPHCTGVFYQEEATCFIDHLYDMTDHNQCHRDAIDKFCHADRVQDRIDVIEDFLLKHLATKPVCTITNRAIKSIIRYPAHRSSPELADMAFSSERNMRRRFVQHVGLAPKKYASIFRFRKMVSSIMAADEEIDWWKVVIEYGYYDTSHLWKDFKKYTELSPIEYLSQYQIDSRLLPQL